MPLSLIGDPGALEAERFYVRLAPGGDEQVATLEDASLAVFGEVHGDALRRALDALHPRVGVEHHLRLGQPLEEYGGGLGVFAGEKAFDIEHADMGAEHAMGLGEFEADRTAAQNDQMLDTLAHVEDRLVGEIRRLVEAGDRRNRRHRSGGDDESPGAHQDAAGLDRELVEETCLRLDDANAQARHPLDRVVRGNGGDDAVHMIVDAAMVDLGLDDVDAKGGGGAHGFRPLARREQRLGGDAAIVETVAAHAPLFDQHHGHAELRRHRRDR